MALDVVGSSRLVFGSDYPLEVRTADGMQEMIAMIDALPAPASRAAIKSGNARDLLFAKRPHERHASCAHRSRS
jgi:predicted TIM-barrel fold metal-dependent hydrolase